MTKLGIIVGISATVLCLSAEAQTITVMVLDQAGADTVLRAAEESARQKNAPSAIAVVDPAGDLMAFQRMDGVRPDSGGLAIQKARTAARLRRSTAEIETNINNGRTAFVTAGIEALRGACRSCWTVRSWAPGASPGRARRPTRESPRRRRVVDRADKDISAAVITRRNRWC
jgi:glc operon protein GlcG